MSNAKIKFLIGYLTGIVISLVLIHFIAADIFAKILGVSVPVAYCLLVAILLLWAVITTVRVIKGTDSHLQHLESASSKNANT